MARRLPMLASSIRAVVAPVLRECPQECGIVTITEVDVSADLSYVTVYISAFRETKVALAFLESRRSEFRKRLGALQTHKTPLLRFRVDRTIEEGNRIDALLERASKNTSDDSSKTSQ